MVDKKTYPEILIQEKRTSIHDSVCMELMDKDCFLLKTILRKVGWREEMISDVGITPEYCYISYSRMPIAFVDFRLNYGCSDVFVEVKTEEPIRVFETIRQINYYRSLGGTGYKSYVLVSCDSCFDREIFKRSKILALSLEELRNA